MAYSGNRVGYSDPLKKLTDEVNKMITPLTNLESNVGDKSTLSTTDKTSLVKAINELVTTMGNKSSLSTVAKTSLVLAINELVINLGSLSSLKTSDKTSLVNAINNLSDSFNTAEENIANSISALSSSKQDVLASDQIRKITISTGEPTGGSEGDIWFQYSE